MPASRARSSRLSASRRSSGCASSTRSMSRAILRSPSTRLPPGSGRRASSARAGDQEGPDGIGLAHVGRGRAGRRRWREGPHVLRKGGRCAARCGLALPEHGEVRARWSAFGPDGRFDSLQLGQAAENRADARRRARAGDPPPTTVRATAGRQASDDGRCRTPATTLAPASLRGAPASAPRGPVARVGPKGSRRRGEQGRRGPRLTPPERLASVRRRRSHGPSGRSSSAAEQLIRNQ